MYVFSEKPNTKLEERLNRVEMEWEYRYMRIIESEDWLKLFFFLGDFKEHCIKVVTNIINRIGNVEALTNLDHRFQTSKPGERVYLKDNIVVRIARMQFVDGRYDTDSFKALNQEMISNNCINNLCLMFLHQNTMKLRVPVTCLVEYMGHRAFCQADTTCSGSSTLQYGCTADRMFKYNETVDVMLKKVGKHLNLKPYDVMTTEKVQITVPLSLHVQVHHAKTEKLDDVRKLIREESYLHTEIERKPQRDDYYLFNLWRLWPIYVSKNLESNKGFLRPEYVINWNKPLSNAVFQNIAYRVDEEGELDLADACKTLKDDRISELSKRLDDS